MSYKLVCGIETHIELATKTKIFCSCTTQFGGEPNTHCCPVCTGQPGALPVLNREVINFAVRAGLAVHCKINNNSHMDRKNYVYPDLPKAYQISPLTVMLSLTPERKSELSVSTLRRMPVSLFTRMATPTLTITEAAFLLSRLFQWLISKLHRRLRNMLKNSSLL